MIASTEYVANRVEVLNNVKARKKTVKQVIANAVNRITSEQKQMTTKAIDHLVSFCTALATVNTDVDAELLNRNVYAVEKAKKIVVSVARYIDKGENAKTHCVDEYTCTILAHLIKRGDKLTKREQTALLSVNVECDTLEATAKRMHKGESTASTQSSSTRAALKYLDLIEVDGDLSITLKDSEQAKQFADMLTNCERVKPNAF